MADGGDFRRISDRVVVLGGGPAGLTAAHELCRSGVPSVVLERQSTVGGLAKTVEYKGYRFDLGGHRFFTKVPWVEAMWEDLLGEDFLVRPRLSRIFYRDRFFHYPLRPFNAFFGLGALPSIGVALSFAKARLRPVEPETTFEDWVSNRFGRKLFHAFFKTYTEKVLGIPCTDISADWAAERIQGLSLSVAVRNALAGSRPEGTVRTLIDEFHYPRLGPGMLWQALADRIADSGGEVRCGHSVTRVHWSGDRITAVGARTAGGDEKIVSGSHFVSSMALRDFVRALDPPAPDEVRAAAERLGYRDFILVALVIDRADLFADNWIYIHDDTVRVGRIQNFKNWSPDMVPDPAMTSVGLEYFCSRGDDLWRLTDSDLQDLAALELERLGLARRVDVVDGKVERVPQAYPVYDVAYRSHVDAVRRFLGGLHNLQLVGRNGRHQYINQDHAMVSAMQAVGNLLGTEPRILAARREREYGERAAAE